MDKLVSSIIIDNDSTLVNTNPVTLPKSILLNKSEDNQKQEPKKRGRKPMTDEEKKESKRQRNVIKK